MSRPITIIGAGAIVRHAHLPAYRDAGWTVAGIYDRNLETAQALASEFGIEKVFESLEEAAAGGGIFDIATPAKAFPDVLAVLPQGATVLLQKPFGETWADACALHRQIRERGLNALLNFQLRHAPSVVEARRLIAAGEAGEILDIEVNVNVHMPWEQWPFLIGVPGMEIVYHSIHYIDLVRALMGEPEGVWCRSMPHPSAPEITTCRTTAIFSRGQIRAVINTYHAHTYGPRHQRSTVKIEGTRAALVLQMGLNIDYPHGAEDWLEISTPDWRRVPLAGNWIPYAFRGPMAEAQTWADDPAATPQTEINDALKTMRLAEACMRSSQSGGLSPDSILSL